ncbi:TadE family protein [Streptomyces malaysiensis]|uniref:Pilus assembly protein TadE n=1 Tax=Streptomyces malaysiensis TaxID=92644 RepID=A0A7X6B149_STRMQ|nr:TadE family protein [Streptomyces malaysiensis]NIY69485.1 pilus assembly protein TadE [Streptomyces malaysiensis]
MNHLLHRRDVPSDHGAATTQLVIVVPALVILAMLVVQFALAWHAHHIAQYAAERALAAARVQHGSAAAGQAQAVRSLSQLGSHVLTSPSVTVRRTSTQATVRVQGEVMPVVPGLRLTASGAASGAVERITLPAGAHS